MIEDRDRMESLRDDRCLECGTFDPIYQLRSGRLDEEEYAPILLLEALSEPFLTYFRRNHCM